MLYNFPLIMDPNYKLNKTPLLQYWRHQSNARGPTSRMSDKSEVPKEESSKFRFRAPGISKLEATSVFRVTNFELFTRPNAAVMILGVMCFTGALSYIAYMNYQVVVAYAVCIWSLAMLCNTRVYAKYEYK